MGKRKKTGGGEKKENAERTKRIRGLCPFRSVLYQKRLILIYFYRTDAYTVIPFLFCFCCPESDGDAHSHIIQYFIQRLTFESRSVSELVDRRVFQDETYPVDLFQPVEYCFEWIVPECEDTVFPGDLLVRIDIRDLHAFRCFLIIQLLSRQ